MNSVRVRNLTIGEGMPKICVPVVGKTKEEILENAEAAVRTPADMVEWRADWYDEVLEGDKVKTLLKELRGILGDIPLLFTFRTAGEGGEREIGKEDYVNLNIMAVKSGMADLIDVEAFFDETVTKELVVTAHESDVKVVMSNHDFDKTPEQQELVRRLCYMQDTGADIPKIAVMPTSKEDVLVLLSATREMSEEHADRPIITMSMAGMGLISRLCGEIFGSAVTFGAAGKTSAPGQIDVEELSCVLHSINGNL